MATTGAAVVTGTIPAARTASQPSAPAGASPQQTARHDLARSLQKELKRVGCYSGEANGEWTAASRHAMNAFLQRLNASLPTAEPDFILLTLVQGQTTAACNGSATVAQQKPAPTANQANEASKAAEIGTPWRTAVTPAKAPPHASDTRVTSNVAVPPSAVAVAVPASPIAGRMAIGGPVGAAPAETQSSGQQSPPVAKLSQDHEPSVKTPSPKPRPAAAPRRTETHERQASAPRPHRDTSWTKNFFER